MFVLRAVFFFLFCLAGCAQAQDVEKPVETVKIGVIDNFSEVFFKASLPDLIRQLNQRLPGYHFELVNLNSVSPAESVLSSGVQFFISSAGTFWEIYTEVQASHIATRKSTFATDPSASTGSAFVVLSERKDLQQLKDLRGKTAVANQPNSFEGWLAAQREIKENSFDPDNFFKEVSFKHFLYPEAFSVLAAGWADVAVLPSCLLEQLEQEGLIDPQDYRVIDGKPRDTLKCRHSTALYPGIVIAARENVSPQLAWEVTSVLLSLPPTDGYEWSIAKRFSAVNDLYKSLEIGPYSHLKDFSLQGLLNRWKVEILTVLAVILFLIGNSLYLRKMVQKRTLALKNSLEKQLMLERQARESRQRLWQLEKFGVISQMSGMLAHELQQPLLAINNYLSGLKIYLDRKGVSDQITEKSISHIEFNSTRISDIIGRVRGYAKSKKREKQECDFHRIIEQALSNLHTGSFKDIPVKFSETVHKAPVFGDPLELELVVINLLRNACSAASKGASPQVEISLTEADPDHWLVSVRDNGPALTEKEFERLTSLGDSIKPDGMGIGLSLVRGIADAHGAQLKFFRAGPNGVQADFKIEKEKTENADASGKGS